MQSPRPPEASSRAISFAYRGVLLSLGSPLGLLLVRSIASRTWPTLDFIGAQINSDPVLYAYSTFSTMLIFVLLGRTLGARQDQLAKTSLTDPLTHLHNRRHLNTMVEEALNHASQHEGPLVMLLVDVDHLKLINDRGGHDAGDRALLCVAEALRKSCRASDLPIRYGGDEFVVLLPSTTSTQALHVCERIRLALQQCSAKLPIPLTVSIGVAEAGMGTSSAGALFEAADGALYAAKKAGRNRVVVAGDAAKENSPNVS